MRETAAGIGRTVAFAVVAIAIVIGTVVVSNRMFYEPQRQRGFVAHVSGLLTTYCSSDRTDVRSASRMDLIGQRDGKPERWAQLGASLRGRLEAAIGNQEGACQ